MRVHEKIFENRNDFSATYLCEHCGHLAYYQYGYCDNKFYNDVIPAMNCPWCGKNSDGSLATTRNGITASPLQKAEKYMKQVESFRIIK